MIEIYTDGSSKGNPGEGGFGVIAKDTKTNKIIHVYKKREKKVTNNQAELKAILYALELISNEYKGCKCIIYSDSLYCVNICNDWIHKWAKNNWINSRNQQVENVELIKSLYKYINIDFSNFQIKKLKGHDGIIENEIADALATNNKTKFKKLIQENNIEFDIPYPAPTQYLI
jgi:ribonuclease HI